jgi:hypothetical protein
MQLLNLLNIFVLEKNLMFNFSVIKFYQVLLLLEKFQILHYFNIINIHLKF